MKEIRREEIMRMIPHQGEMCLLDEIFFWDQQFLNCRSRSFATMRNPLRRADGTLGMACGIEIAAQAMAAHGRLIAGIDAPPVPGMLVSLRDIELSAGPLDAIEILIEVERLMGDAAGASYRFLVSERAGKMLTGRATVLFAGAA